MAGTCSTPEFILQVKYQPPFLIAERPSEAGCSLLQATQEDISKDHLTSATGTARYAQILKGMGGWVLIGVVSSKKKKKKKHACKVKSHLQFVKGLVGVRVLQLFELEKLERSPRHFQLPPPSASVYLRIVLFTSDVITLSLCARPATWHYAFWVEGHSLVPRLSVPDFVSQLFYEGQWARRRLGSTCSACVKSTYVRTRASIESPFRYALLVRDHAPRYVSA